MRRRGRIEKRGKSFRVEIELGRRDDGTRERIRKTFPTRKEAERYLAEQIVELDEERELGVGNRFTVEQVVGLWYEAKQHAPRTRYDYELVEKWLPERFLSREVGDVRPADVTKLFAALRKEGRSEFRLLRLHELLRGAFDHAWRMEWIRENPILKVPRPTPKRKTPKPPSRSEVEELVRNAPAELMLWIRIAATTGARRGEIAALRWESIDFGSKTIRFHRAISYAPSSGLLEGPTKTEDDRLVAVGDVLLDELRAAMHDQIDRAERIGVEWTPRAFVIGADPVGETPWRPDRATRVFRELREDLGLPETIRLKELRHFVATQLLAARVDVRTVAGRLGHSQTSTTTDIYAQWLHEADQRAADLLD